MPSQKQPPQERPELTPERNVETGVKDSFPASDPVSATASQGARAVPADEMMRGDGAKPAQDGNSVTLTQRFRDAEAAKLAVEALVRDGPVDRRCAEIMPAGDAVTVRLAAPREDAARLRELLQQQADRSA